MRSYLVGIEAKRLVRAIIYLQTLCMRAAKAQASLRGRAVSPEPWLLGDTIPCAGLFGFRLGTVYFYGVESWSGVFGRSSGVESDF